MIDQCNSNEVVEILKRNWSSIIQCLTPELKQQMCLEFQNRLLWRTPPEFIVQSVAVYCALQDLLSWIVVNHYWYRILIKNTACWSSLQLYLNIPALNQKCHLQQYYIPLNCCLLSLIQNCTLNATKMHVQLNMASRLSQMKQLRALTLSPAVLTDSTWLWVRLWIFQLPHLVSITLCLDHKNYNAEALDVLADLHRLQHLQIACNTDGHSYPHTIDWISLLNDWNHCQWLSLRLTIPMILRSSNKQRFQLFRSSTLTTLTLVVIESYWQYADDLFEAIGQSSSLQNLHLEGFQHKDNCNAWNMLFTHSLAQQLQSLTIVNCYGFAHYTNDLYNLFTNATPPSPRVCFENVVKISVDMCKLSVLCPMFPNIASFHLQNNALKAHLQPFSQFCGFQHLQSLQAIRWPVELCDLSSNNTIVGKIKLQQMYQIITTLWPDC